MRDLITRVTFRFLCKSFIIFTTRQTLSNTVFTKSGFFFSHFEFFRAQQIILLFQMQHKFNIKFTNKHGSSFSLEKKDHIKYLGVLIDEKLTWKNQISNIWSRISTNTGIFLRLRRYLSLKQLKQLHHTLIYPYINYAIISWGSASTSNLNKIQVK